MPDLPKLEVVTEKPFNAGTPLPALLEPVTPSDSVYVRNHFEMPQIESSAWTLRLGGVLDSPFELSMESLRRRPVKTLEMTLECAGNGRTAMQPVPGGTPWGLNAVSVVRFTGTPLRGLLEEAGLRPEVVEILFTGRDSGEVQPGRNETYARSLPVELALHSDILLAWEMNGEPLSRQHGAPLRLAVPGWYGMASVKWLQEITAVSEPFKGFFQREHYVYLEEAGTPSGAPVRYIRVRSLIVHPPEGDEVGLGEVEIVGVAWSGEGAIDRVELSTDGGASWQSAELGAKPAEYGACYWTYRWRPARAGRYTLTVRATDTEGRTQPLQQRWNLLGYGNNGPHSITVTAS